jgi:CHAT domain-containing protein
METLHNIGLVHFAQGDYQLAIDAYLRGLHLNRAIRDQWFSAEALRNLGAAAWRLGQHARAEADFRESLAIARRSRNRPIEAELLDDLGQMALAGGRLAPATRLFSRALDLRTEMADYAGVTESLTSLATARLRAGQPTAALALASRAVSNATTHDQPELLWHAQTVEGIAYRRLHRPGDARRSLLAAVDSIEQLSADLVDRDNLRQRFLEDKLSPYHELIAIAMEAHRFEEAVEWAERSRARALAELLGGGRLDDDAILTGDEARERRRLRNAMFTLNRQIDGDTSGRRQDLESARREARDALAAFDATLAARHPELAAARGAVKPFDFADVNACLRDRHTAALEFVVTDTRVFALLAMRTGTGVAVEGRVVDADAATLARLAGRVRDQIGSRDQAFKATASDLFALLVKPFAAALEGVKTLVIVPDGALWNVPFQALLGPKGYLIESAAIAYAPSLTVLRETEQLPGRTGPPTVLAMGRSRFDAPAAGPSFEQLPEADDQLRAIRDIYGPQRSLTLTGDEANETRLKAMADRFSVLHIATHGVLDEVSPLYSYLLLAPGPNNDDDDGRLEAWEIMHLSLRADLVVLAACDTGRGRIAPGEGVIGMMWALFAAGARSMIVSQFQVEATSATAELIGFHRELAAGSLSSAESLQRAAVRLLHTPRFAHPYYWAGFVLVGDPE